MCGFNFQWLRVRIRILRSMQTMGSIVLWLLTIVHLFKSVLWNLMAPTTWFGPALVVLLLLLASWLVILLVIFLSLPMMILCILNRCLRMPWLWLGSLTLCSLQSVGLFFYWILLIRFGPLLPKCILSKVMTHMHMSWRRSFEAWIRRIAHLRCTMLN